MELVVSGQKIALIDGAFRFQMIKEKLLKKGIKIIDLDKYSLEETQNDSNS